LSYSENDALSTLVSEGATRCLVPTPFGKDFLIVGNDVAILAGAFVARRRAKWPKPSDALLVEAGAQLRAYFARRLRRFHLPLHLSGTPLQLAAWEAVAALSYGEFVSYADVARAIGRPGAHRGVAAAMGATPIDLFIPAHRVLGADGRIRGAGPGSMRPRLLAFERAYPASGSP
jgi:methylated-DNA-[protein]-cysteine S-methyltransferase